MLLASVISVIIPVYRDAEALGRTLTATEFSGADVIVSLTPDDSSLAPLRLARPDIVWVDAPPGRARQMNAGAAAARGQWLVFLHADTQLPSGWTQTIEAADRDPRVSAGCFRFALDSRSLMARAIELGVRASRCSGCHTAIRRSSCGARRSRPCGATPTCRSWKMSIWCVGCAGEAACSGRRSRRSRQRGAGIATAGSAAPPAISR
jgi:glycosyltransferase involved in cell wall biosynthesis